MSLFRNKEEPYCLVLSGGGAKGVFHIGAWKALKELGIEVNAFIGNSIGAIIAGFLAQGNEEQLYELGDNFTVDHLIKIPEDLIEKGELKVSIKHLSAFSSFYKDALLGGGLDTSPIRQILNESLNEELIRKSGNDLGVVTFNISRMKPREVFIEQMEEGTVIDYLMASSAVPGFAHPVIKGKKYIDGGVFDNMPYRMARLRGYRKIIVIDISGMGINRRPNIGGSETIYIKNSIHMGGILDFNREFLDSFMELGYLDTMKTFGKLKGYNYFIVPDRKIEKKFTHTFSDDKTKNILEIRNLLPGYMKADKDIFYPFLDCCAQLFKLERVHRYSVKELSDLLLKEKGKEDSKLSYLGESQSEGEANHLFNRIEMIFKNSSSRDSLKETPYYYSKIISKALHGHSARLLQKSLHRLYPELAPGLFLLEFLEE